MYLSHIDKYDMFVTKRPYFFSPCSIEFVEIFQEGQNLWSTTRILVHELAVDMGRGFNLCRPAKTDVGYSDVDDEDVDYMLVEGLNLRQATKTPPFLAHKSVGMFLFGPSTNLSSGRYTPPCMQRKYKTRDRRCLQQLIKENEYFNCDQLPFQEKHKFSSCSIGAWEDS